MCFPSHLRRIIPAPSDHATNSSHAERPEGCPTLIKPQILQGEGLGPVDHGRRYLRPRRGRPQAHQWRQASFYLSLPSGSLRISITRDGENQGELWERSGRDSVCSWRSFQRQNISTGVTSSQDKDTRSSVAHRASIPTTAVRERESPCWSFSSNANATERAGTTALA